MSKLNIETTKIHMLVFMFLKTISKFQHWKNTQLQMSFITRKHKGMQSPHTSFPIIQYILNDDVSSFPRLKD